MDGRIRSTCASVSVWVKHERSPGEPTAGGCFVLCETAMLGAGAGACVETEHAVWG